MIFCSGLIKHNANKTGMLFFSIFSQYLEFQGSCETKELPFVEVSVDRNAKDISMFVSMKNYSKENTEGSMEVIWEGDISEGKKKNQCKFLYIRGTFLPKLDQL